MLIVESRHRLSRWAWVEARLFEVVGSWSGSTPAEPEVARWSAATASHHAWRSSLWAARVPVLHDVADPGVPSGWPALLAAVAAPSSAWLRLTGYDVAASALEAEYSSAVLDDVCDGPVQRAMSLVLPDAKEDRRTALALLAVAPDDVQVADHRSSLTALRGGLD